jgi:hypothetical protein
VNQPLGLLRKTPFDSNDFPRFTGGTVSVQIIILGWQVMKCPFCLASPIGHASSLLPSPSSWKTTQRIHDNPSNPPGRIKGNLNFQGKKNQNILMSVYIWNLL